MKHLNFWVSGRVQGVFYRKFILQKALQLGIKGMVKNLNDGRVYIEAEGNEAQLKALHTFCCEGPPAAKVIKVESEEAALINYQSFLISR